MKTPKGVKSTGQHKVKVLEDKIIRKSDPNTGKDIEWVRYIIEENGEKKVYDTKLRDKTGGLSYLVQRFAEIKEGEELLLEMKKQGIKNYIEVTPTGQTSTVEIDEDLEEEDIISKEEAAKIMEAEMPDLLSNKYN